MAVMPLATLLNGNAELLRIGKVGERLRITLRALLGHAMVPVQVEADLLLGEAECLRDLAHAHGVLALSKHGLARDLLELGVRFGLGHHAAESLLHVGAGIERRATQPRLDLELARVGQPGVARDRGQREGIDLAIGRHRRQALATPHLGRRARGVESHLGVTPTADRDRRPVVEQQVLLARQVVARADAAVVSAAVLLDRGADAVDDPRPRVRRITLNRPEKRNALNTALTQALLDAMRAAAEARGEKPRYDRR